MTPALCEIVRSYSIYMDKRNNTESTRNPRMLGGNTKLLDIDIMHEIRTEVALVVSSCDLETMNQDGDMVQHLLSFPWPFCLVADNASDRVRCSGKDCSMTLKAVVSIRCSHSSRADTESFGWSERMTEKALVWSELQYDMMQCSVKHLQSRKHFGSLNHWQDSVSDSSTGSYWRRRLLSQVSFVVAKRSIQMDKPSTLPDHPAEQVALAEMR